MRLALIVAGLALLAACQKPPETVPLAPAAAADGDDRNAADLDAATSPPNDTREFTALSKTAISITGDLLIAPTPPPRPNLPPGATFTFSKGMTLTTTELPGGAMQGDPPFDWSAAFPTMKPGDIDKIEMYSVETERPQPPGPSGGLCDKTFFIATLLDDAGTPDPKDDTLSLAAFSSDSWPPKDPNTALCGTFGYIPAE